MTAKLYKLRRMALPNEPGKLLTKLADGVESGKVTGLAIIALLDGAGYIAETCGEASEDLAQTRLLLKAFEAKLAKRQLGAR